MNKLFKLLLCLVLLLFITSSFVFAEENIRIRFDGEFVETDNPPVVVDGRTLVPLRDVFELFDFTVAWDSKTNTAIGSINNFEIKMPINSKSVTVGGISFELDVPATLINGSTYIPVRFVSERIGAEVKWIEHHRIIDIYTATLDNSVSFANVLLENKIKNILNISIEDDVLIRDIRFLTKLDISNNSITRLNGLEHMEYLQTLNVSNNSISDISSIKDLEYLKELNLANNEIKNIGTISALKSLEYIDLQNNEINYLTPLENLKHLRTLKLSDNDLSYDDDEFDFGPLYYLPNSIEMDLVKTAFQEPKYNTWNLRSEADFEIKIDEDLFWVPASKLSLPWIINSDINEIISNNPTGKSSQINALFSALQYLQHVDFKLINDDKTVTNLDESRMWTYHKPANDTLTENIGSKRALANAMSFLLSKNYEESGILTLVDSNNNSYYLNYIKEPLSYTIKDDNDENSVITEDYFYIFDAERYLKQNKFTSTIEDGDLETYNSGLGIKGNIHKTKDLMTFSRAYLGDNLHLAYKVAYLDDEDFTYSIGHYVGDRGASKNYYFLPGDSKELDSDDDDYHFWYNRIKLLYDNTDDDIIYRLTENNLTSPTW